MINLLRNTNTASKELLQLLNNLNILLKLLAVQILHETIKQAFMVVMVHCRIL